MLIGDVRDAKTASEAVRAAITGHRVFSTLHTNDAVSAILRLHDLGVDYSYIAATLNCVVAQRLVRKLCPACSREELVTPTLLPEHERMFLSGPGQVVRYPDVRGCAHCFEGHAGRTVVAETLFVDDQMRFMIEQGLVHEIALKAREIPSALTMRADAARLVREGIIAIDEAVRVVG
jgi:type IV pilus assembly protein PilB